MYLPFPEHADLISQFFTDEFKDVIQLHPEEMIHIAGSSAKRQTDFSTGRFCARKALEKFGLDNVSIPRKKDNQAEWPEGFTGSISHSNYMCGAVVARTKNLISVGIDIETIGGVELNMWDMLFTKAEQDFLLLQNESEQKLYSTLLFSAKESFYKFQFPISSEFLEFNEVELSIRDRKIAIKVKKDNYSAQYLDKAEIEWIVKNTELISMCYLTT